MNIILSSRGLFAIGFLILLVTNIFVLSRVSANRSGNPDAILELTERELMLPYGVSEENSGLSLRINWRVLGEEKNAPYYYGYFSSGAPEWFTVDRLAELGFDMAAYGKMRDNLRKYKEPIPKEVFIVLEKEGASYRKAIQRAEAALAEPTALYAANPDSEELKSNLENARERVVAEKISLSRLFAVDAGLDAETLRARYKDRSTHIVTKGVVAPSRTYVNQEEKTVGYISNLSVESIYVPLQHRRILDAILLEQTDSGDERIIPPRYRIKLAYGSRLEPWIMSVEKLDRPAGYPQEKDEKDEEDEEAE